MNLTIIIINNDDDEVGSNNNSNNNKTNINNNKSPRTKILTQVLNQNNPLTRVTKLHSTEKKPKQMQRVSRKQLLYPPARCKLDYVCTVI